MGSSPAARIENIAPPLSRGGVFVLACAPQCDSRLESRITQTSGEDAPSFTVHSSRIDYTALLAHVVAAYARSAFIGRYQPGTQA